MLLTPQRVSGKPDFSRSSLTELLLIRAMLKMPLEWVLESTTGSSRPYVAWERLRVFGPDALWVLYLSSEAAQR